jgi:hypothetical protein
VQLRYNIESSARKVSSKSWRPLEVDFRLMTTFYMGQTT